MTVTSVILPLLPGLTDCSQYSQEGLLAALVASYQHRTFIFFPPVMLFLLSLGGSQCSIVEK